VFNSFQYLNLKGQEHWSNETCNNYLQLKSRNKKNIPINVDTKQSYEINNSVNTLYIIEQPARAK
jgi:hypothetical protein